MGIEVVYLILFIAGALCFLAAAFGWRTPSPPAWNIVALGLFCWILVELIRQARSM